MPAYSDGAGPAIDLTPADSIHYGQALAVNNAGDIVGISGLNPASSTSSATIWPAAAPPATISGEPSGIDLNCLIPADAGIHLTEANAINGTGSILAEGLVGTATEWSADADPGTSGRFPGGGAGAVCVGTAKLSAERDRYADQRRRRRPRLQGAERDVPRRRRWNHGLLLLRLQRSGGDGH